MATFLATNLFTLDRRGMLGNPYYFVDIRLGEYVGYLEAPKIILDMKVRIDGDKPGHDLYKNIEIECSDVGTGLKYYDEFVKYYITDIEQLVKEHELTVFSGYEEIIPDIYSRLIMNKI